MFCIFPGNLDTIPSGDVFPFHVVIQGDRVIFMMWCEHLMGPQLLHGAPERSSAARQARRGNVSVVRSLKDDLR